MLNHNRWFICAFLLSLTPMSFSSDSMDYQLAEEKVTNTGAVFTRDNSNPKLGEAWRDPNGLIWGQQMVRFPNGDIRRSISFDYAKEHCKNLGARLPTKAEFESLKQFFGGEHYKPQILPNLPGKHGLFPVSWSSTIIYHRYGATVLTYSFETGKIWEQQDIKRGRASVHCVTKLGND